MDIDKLFNLPKLTNSKKRQLPDAPTPEMLKRMRMDTEPGPSTVKSVEIPDPPKTKPRGVTVEDVDEDAEGEDEDEDAGDFAPGGDADYFAEEDEEGRFFGGGLTDEQKTILNIFENAGDNQEVDDLTAPGIRRLLLRFERAMKKNQDQRSKYPDDPTKFIDSEADLDAALKALLPLPQVPTIAYPEIVKTGTSAALVDLLSHENADIVIDVVELIKELTDEDVGNESDDEEDEEGNREEALKELVDDLLNRSILELLVQNLSRFNEEEESDREGVFHILGIFENTLGFKPELSARLVSETNILPWLLERIGSKTHDANRGYAAEVLSILLQDNRQNRLKLGEKNGVEILLKVISQFRKRDPVDADETEFMENCFDALCSALIEPEIKKPFLKEEGVDLMVLIMKEKNQSRSRAIKTLDHAMSGVAGSANCETFVEAFGLKTLFSAFMGKQDKKGKGNATAAPASEDTSHILGIMASLFSNLESDSAPRVRLLTKFVEENYEKVDRLLEIRENADARLKIAEKEIEQERNDLIADGVVVGENEQDTWYLRRLDSGLFVLQTVDYILGWLCMEDDGIRSHVSMIIGRKNKTLKDIVEVLKVYRDNVGEDEMRTDDAEAAPSQREILEGLIAFLEGC
ncbi:hypothetical protein M422DRAFT_218491 [Sphaerobolus stellatus SS14]|nr:hypothetical protein M422DRAFT_218491 [Sphaerobolus stellatus SS14]